MRHTHLPFFLLLLALAQSAAAISVSPISAELDLSGKRSHLVTVINTDEHRSAPIKVEALTWVLTPEGTDKRTPAEDIIVFPGQFILRPGEQRSVRVAPRYTKAPNVEKSYRILIYEVPVDLASGADTDKQSGIRLLTAYATAFYVRPAKPHAELHLDAVQRRDDGLLFSLSNHGNAHSHLLHLRLLITQNGKTVRIENPDELKNFSGENVLAGSVRNFIWKWPTRHLDNIDKNHPVTVRVEMQCESCDGSQAAFESSVP